MANVFRLRKGLNVNLVGRAKEQTVPLKLSGVYSLVPDDFVGLTPKVAVREGSHVLAGEALFVDKGCLMLAFLRQ